MTRANRQVRFYLLSLLLAIQAGLARADNACHYIEQADLAVKHAGHSRLGTIAGAINGKPVDMLLDTGANETYILRAQAEELNLNPVRTGLQVQGVGGNASVFVVKIKDFAIGDAHVNNLRFPVVEGLEKTGMGGIVGDDFLMQYDIELNFAANRVKLFHAENCGDKGLAYWDPHAMSVPLEWAPDSHQPMVQVKINGMALWALIDTGANGTTIDLDAVRRLGLSTDAPGVVSGGKAAGIGSEKRTMWHMTFDSFAIGDETIQHPRIAVLDTGFRMGRKSHEVILGRDFLNAHHVLLAQSQMQFYFSYTGGPVFLKDEIDAIGLPHAAP